MGRGYARRGLDRVEWVSVWYVVLCVIGFICGNIVAWVLGGEGVGCQGCSRLLRVLVLHELCPRITRFAVGNPMLLPHFHFHFHFHAMLHVDGGFSP